MKKQVKVMSTKKKFFARRAVLLTVVLCLMLVACLSGCRQTQLEETTTQPDATVDTVPSTTAEDQAPETTEEELNVLQVGHMTSDVRGKNGNEGVYFNMEPNDIPADSSWATEYRPTSAGCIQLIRDGETYNIAKTAAGAIIKFSATEYYLKLEQWIIRDYYPITDGDILVVSGMFRNGAADLFFEIETTYIQYTQGLVVFSNEYPTSSGVNVTYVGNLSADTRGMNGSDGLYFDMEKNSLPYDKDWALEYKPASESSVQLIRNGNTYNIGNTAAGMIVKFSETEYYLKLEKWIIKDFYPVRDGDILVINGRFTNTANRVVASFPKTYISLKEGLLKFSTTFPSGDDTVEAVPITNVRNHPNGYGSTGLYFYADENAIKADNSWATEYRPQDANCVKLIRDGQTYAIGNTAAGALIKYSDTEWFLKLEKWIYKDFFPFQAGDILLLNGKFVNAGTAEICSVENLYISIGNGTIKFSTTYPTEDGGTEELNAGNLIAGENVMLNGGTGFYFNMSNGSVIPANGDDNWDNRFKPVSEDTIKLIRDGKTVSIGNTAAGEFVKYSETGYYMDIAAWSHPTITPLKGGDVLVIEGYYSNGETVFKVEKSTVTIAENGMLSFGSSVPEPEEPEKPEKTLTGLKDGSLSYNSGDNSYTVNFQCDAYGNTDVVILKPEATNNVQLIRNGTTYSIAAPGNDTIAIWGGGTSGYVRVSQFYANLAESGCTLGELTAGDVLVISGTFTDGTQRVGVEKTTITIGEGNSVTIEAGNTEPEKPEELNAGNLIAGENVMLNGGTGFYFGMSNGSVIPANGDNNWDNRFMPTSADTLKLVRDGVTTSIGNPGAGEFVKYSETGYYMDVAAWSHPSITPLKGGDVLIVEGYYSNGTVTFKVEKTTITIGEDGSLTFEAESTEPEKPEELNAGNLIAGENVMLNGGTGFYFGMSNGSVIPANGDNNWDNRFMPTSADTLKLVRDGVTTSIGNPGAGEFVKYSETGYYMDVAAWSHPSITPLKGGDVLIVEGYYSNGTVTFKVEKTTITIGEDGSLTFKAESTEAPSDKDIQGGYMSASTQTWNANESGWFNNNTALYFALNANAIPVSSDWSVEYGPEKVSTLQLTRGGETYNIANPGRGTVIKIGDSQYVLKLESWTIGEYANLQVGDVLTVEGTFVGVPNASGVTSEYTLTISKTQITIGEGYVLSYASMEASAPSIIEAGQMTPHADGWNKLTNTSFSFTLPANDAPSNADGEIAYVPTEASAVTLIRDGNSISIANPQREILAKIGDTHYKLRLDNWTIGSSYVPIVPGDILVVDGCFYYAPTDSTIRISKTVVIVGDDYVLTYADEVPEAPLELQNLKGEALTHNESDNSYRLNFSGTALDNADTLVLQATDVNNVQLVREGKPVGIAAVGRDTLVVWGGGASGNIQFSQFYANVAGTGVQDVTPKQGDLFIVQGRFVSGNVVVEVEKTYIQVGADNALTFSNEDPAEAGVIKAGTVGAHATGLRNGILYFTMAENELPSHRNKTDYKPVDASVIKLIRGGKTYDVADPSKKTVEKYSASNYKLLTSALTMTLQDGDILVISGKFTGGQTDSEETVVFSITESRITITSVEGNQVTYPAT